MIYFLVFLMSLMLDSPNFQTRESASQFLDKLAINSDIREELLQAAEYKPSLEKQERINRSYNMYYVVKLDEKLYIEDLGYYPFQSQYDFLFHKYFGGQPNSSWADGVQFTDYSYNSIYTDNTWKSSEKANKLTQDLLERHIAQLAYETKESKFKIIERLKFRRDLRVLIGGLGFTIPK